MEYKIGDKIILLTPDKIDIGAEFEKDAIYTLSSRGMKSTTDGQVWFVEENVHSGLYEKDFKLVTEQKEIIKPAVKKSAAEEWGFE